jgi:predicted outer membrane repeat protein
MIFASSLTLTNAAITGNEVTGSGTVNGIPQGLGGGISVFNAGQVMLTGGEVSGNTASVSGAGIFGTNAAKLTLIGTTLAENAAQVQGGGILWLGTGGITVDRATFRANTAVSGGGGLASGGVLTVTNSTFQGNTTTSGNGGGIWSGIAANGTITNVTLSGNSAGLGGGLAATGTATLRNLTIVDNTASDLGGGVGASGATGIIRLNSTLLSGNDDGGTPDNCNASTGGTLVSQGGNLSDDATCAVLTQPGDKANTAAGVNATLADNGGPTLTHALLEGSAAINGGNSTGCPTADQRGFLRQGVCDIGSFEFGGTAPAPVSGLRAARPRPAAPVRGMRGPMVRDSRPTAVAEISRGGTAAATEMR